jgi:hypothetical protein
MMEGSIPQLPQRGWAVALFRGLCIVWIFGGFLIISEGIVMLPALANHHGILMLLVVISAAAAATTAVLWLTRRGA